MDDKNKGLSLNLTKFSVANRDEENEQTKNVENDSTVSNEIISETIPYQAQFEEDEAVEPIMFENSNGSKKVAVLSLIVFMIIAGISMIFLYNTTESEKNTNLAESTQPVQESKPEVKAEFIRKSQTSKFIAYIAEGNVWVSNPEGTNKINITKDGDLYSPYSNLSWKEPGVVSFTKCFANECKIFTYSLNSNKLEEVMKIATPAIFSLNWDVRFFEHPFYIYINPDGQEIAATYSDSEIQIYNFGQTTTNSTTLYEPRYIDFSTDGKYIMIYDTYSENEKLVIFNSDYEKMGIVDGNPISPKFISDNELVYSIENQLHRATVGSFHSTTLASNIAGTDLALSTSKKYLTYSEVLMGKTYTKVYDLDANAAISSFEGFMGAKSINDDEYLAIQESKSSDGTYSINKLVKIEKATNSTIEVESKNVTDFAIE